MGKKKQITVSGDQNKKKAVDSSKTAVITKPKIIKKTRLIIKHGQKYLKARQQILASKSYNLVEAVNLLKKISFEKFDASVELHLNLIEFPLKGEVTLPHGTGKTLKIAILDDKIEKELAENKINFDILIALPKDMSKLVKFAKLLGPKGLMPSPKKGTLTEDPDQAIKKLSSGVVNYKTEAKFPIIHQIVGKKNFSEKQLVDNIKALIDSIGIKKIESLYLKTSMSPTIKLDLNKAE